MTTIPYDVLLGVYQEPKNVLISCPFCKNKKFRIWNAVFENPKLKTNGYKAMITLCNLYKTDERNIICSSKSLKPKNKKLHHDINQNLSLKMCCDSCRRISMLYVSDFHYSNCLYLSWVDPKKRSVKYFGEIKDVEITEERIKKRRAISLGLRYRILTRDNNTCQCCGAKASDGVQLHIDHIKPVSKGGTNILENLQTLCKDCNLGKSDYY